jgi:hypothetical protein
MLLPVAMNMGRMDVLELPRLRHLHDSNRDLGSSRRLLIGLIGSMTKRSGR